jgi:hypothetical protein
MLKKAMRLSKRHRNLLSTLFGAVVAISTAWVSVEWETFAFDFKHIAPLVLSGLVALGGYMTTINVNDK